MAAPGRSGLYEFYQQAHFGHEPGNLSHFKCHRWDRAADQERALLGKVGDCGTHLGNLVANMINSAAFFEDAINWRFQPQGSNKFQHRITCAAAQETYGYFLDRVVKGTSYQFVVKKTFINGKCGGQITNSNPDMMEFEFVQVRSTPS